MNVTCDAGLVVAMPWPLFEGRDNSVFYVSPAVDHNSAISSPYTSHRAEIDLIQQTRAAKTWVMGQT